MSDLVNVRPEDLEKLAGAIRSYQDEIAQASKKMQNAIDKAYWKDDQKEKFANRFKETSKKCDTFVAYDCKEMTQRLRKMLEAIKQYKAATR